MAQTFTNNWGSYKYDYLTFEQSNQFLGGRVGGFIFGAAYNPYNPTNGYMSYVDESIPAATYGFAAIVSGLQPNTDYHLFLDGINVTHACKQIIMPGYFSDTLNDVSLERTGTVFSIDLQATIDLTKISNVPGAENNVGQILTGTALDLLGAASGSYPTGHSSYYDDLDNYHFQNHWTIKDHSSVPCRSSSNGKIQYYFVPAFIDPNNLSSSSLDTLNLAINIAVLQNTQYALLRADGSRVFDWNPANVEVAPAPRPNDNQPITTPGVIWGEWSPWNLESEDPNLISTDDSGVSDSFVSHLPTLYSIDYDPSKMLLSEVSLYFDYLQTFTISSQRVQNSPTVSVVGVDLFFSQIPNPDPEQNASKINRPEVVIFLCETRENGTPDLSKAMRASMKRIRWEDISATSQYDYVGAITSVNFNHPIQLDTDRTYGLVINFEDPQYSLWTSGVDVDADNSNQYKPGGQLFRASNYEEIDRNPETFEDVYKPQDNDLKFNIRVRKYDTENEYGIEMVNKNYEFFTVDSLPYNNRNASFAPSHVVYQTFGSTTANTTYHERGTVQIQLVPQPTTVLTPPAAFNNVIQSDISTQEPYNFIKLVGNNTNFSSTLYPGARVLLTDGTTEISVSINNIEPVNPNFSGPIQEPIQNDQIAFLQGMEGITTEQLNKDFYYKVVPFAEIIDIHKNYDYTYQIVTRKSTADVVHCFTDSGLNYLQMEGTNDSADFQTGDYFWVNNNGGGATALVDIVANTVTGKIEGFNIVSQDLYNKFTNPVVSQIYAKNTTNPSSGSLNNLTITPVIGSQLKVFRNDLVTDIITLDNVEVDTFIPNIRITAHNGDVTNHKAVFTNENALSQFEINNNNYLDIEHGISKDNTQYQGYILSKSNEIRNNNTLITSSSEGKSSIITYTLKTLNPYQAPELIQNLASVHCYSNDINNDATDETLPEHGNAISRYLSKPITFGNDRFAEDVRVIANIWKPYGTDVKLYAKIHNSNDSDNHSDKYWTELDIKQVIDKEYSDKNMTSDLIQIHYGLKSIPEFGSKVYNAINISGDSATVTVNTEDNHLLQNGHYVQVYGAGSHNGVHGPITKTSNTSFTYANNITDTDSSGVTYKRVLPTNLNGQSGTINGNIITLGDTTGIANNDVLYIQDPNFGPEDDASKTLIISVANTPSTTQFEISENVIDNGTEFIADNDIIVKLIKEDNLYQAFNNVQNDRISRYINSANSVFDYYDSISVKAVLLAEDNILVPRIADISVIGVSA